MPDGILSEKKMANLMADVHLLDGYLNTLPVDSSRKVIDGLYEEIFRRYGIDSTAFTKNLSYYFEDPSASKQLYVDVNKKLTDLDRDYRVEDSLENARVSDSIRQVQYYTRLRDEAYQLIQHVYLDSIPLSYRTYRNDFMRRAGLNLNIFQNEEVPVTEPVPLPSSDLQRPAPISGADAVPKALPTVPKSGSTERLLPVPQHKVAPK
ncbi:DUF4296 domain-containing protein [Sphingobacterium griseoflavum]|uniref:DUF4296 domain-containing protein n=1 Tax=Sphingobacterium griseoflavum TaxID=1474952 RepID=A0ABQ3HWX9_9SPHI|nr:DUF4296 domain-containing protein [Sphingobacterium griseoflavum]GHE34123.1 hypothetical protein GCM10017764_16800 [Sphingobacterium griseoflavum]